MTAYPLSFTARVKQEGWQLFQVEGEVEAFLDANHSGVAVRRVLFIEAAGTIDGVLTSKQVDCPEWLRRPVIDTLHNDDEWQEYARITLRRFEFAKEVRLEL